MRTLEIKLGANEVGGLQEIAGRYFEIISAPEALARVDWVGADGQHLSPWIGPEQGWFDASPYRGFSITNGATTQTVKVLVGENTGGNRAAPIKGVISVQKSPGELRVDGGLSFGRAIRCPAQVGQYGGVQFSAPTDKSAKAYVTRVTVVADADMAISIYGFADAVAWDSAKAGFAKSDQVTKSAANVRTGYGLVQPVADGMLWTAAKAGVPVVIELDDPARLVPGRALSIASAALNAGFTVALEWFER